VTERTIARRYVRALFELALEQEAADAVLDDLTRLEAAIASDPGRAAALFDPRADLRARREAAAALVPDGARPLTQDFAAFLVERRREEILPVAAEEFATLLREQRGEVVAEVVAAAPLDPDAREALVARLEEITRKKVALQEKVDASLLGGVRVKVGSTLLDGSVRRRLAGVREDLLRVALPN